jgi:hypothetical protein
MGHHSLKIHDSQFTTTFNDVRPIFGIDIAYAVSRFLMLGLGRYVYASDPGFINGLRAATLASSVCLLVHGLSTAYSKNTTPCLNFHRGRPKAPTA